MTGLSINYPKQSYKIKSYLENGSNWVKDDVKPALNRFESTLVEKGTVEYGSLRHPDPYAEISILPHNVKATKQGDIIELEETVMGNGNKKIKKQKLYKPAKNVTVKEMGTVYFDKFGRKIKPRCTSIQIIDNASKTYALIRKNGEEIVQSFVMNKKAQNARNITAEIQKLINSLGSNFDICNKKCLEQVLKIIK